MTKEFETIESCETNGVYKEAADRGIVQPKARRLVPAKDQEESDRPLPPARTRSPSPTEAIRSIANPQYTMVTNEIKTILRHNVARKAFFEFFKAIKHLELLAFWLDVELLNNEDAVPEEEVMDACVRIQHKYFVTGTCFTLSIYNEPMQNSFMRDWVRNQLENNYAHIKRSFFNHVQNYVALRMFEFACQYRFPDYMSLWQNAKRCEQNKRGYVGEKLKRNTKTESSSRIVHKKVSLSAIVEVAGSE